jgi:hypothetical protein
MSGLRWKRFAVAVALTLAATTACGQSAAATAGWLRASITKWEEPDRTKTLSFLDKARKTSDAIISSLAENDRASAAKLLPPEVLRQWSAAAEALVALKAETAGLHFDYRNQAFELRSTATESEVPTARTWYALAPPPPAIARNFVSVIVEEHDGHPDVVIAIEPVGYSGEIPTWLLRRDAALEPPDPKSH